MLALAGALVSGLNACAEPERTPPNIILVLVDDQGWNGTSVPMDPLVEASRSDYYRTPHLEALAARGMRFSSAYAAAPICSSE